MGIVVEFDKVTGIEEREKAISTDGAWNGIGGFLRDCID